MTIHENKDSPGVDVRMTLCSGQESQWISDQRVVQQRTAEEAHS